MGTNTHQQSPYVKEINGQEDPQVPQNLGYGASREDLRAWVEKELNPVLDEAEKLIRSCPVCGEEKQKIQDIVCGACYSSFEDQRKEIEQLLISGSLEEIEEIEGTNSLTEWARRTAASSIPEETLRRCKAMYPRVWEGYRILDQVAFNVAWAELEFACEKKSIYLSDLKQKAAQRKKAFWEKVEGNRTYKILRTFQKAISFLENVVNAN